MPEIKPPEGMSNEDYLKRKAEEAKETGTNVPAEGMWENELISSTGTEKIPESNSTLDKDSVITEKDVTPYVPSPREMKKLHGEAKIEDHERFLDAYAKKHGITREKK